MCEEDFVSFETAKLLKEKGFDVYTYAYYEDEDNPNISLYASKAINWNKKTEFISKPTLQTAMKWLREKHNLHVDSSIYIDTDGDAEHEYEYTYWDWSIFNSESGKMIAEPEIGCGRYDTYEQACDAGIRYCLEKFV